MTRAPIAQDRMLVMTPAPIGAVHHKKMKNIKEVHDEPNISRPLIFSYIKCNRGDMEGSGMDGHGPLHAST
jgi:hypothetical protein